MTDQAFLVDSFVLYKSHPAKIINIGEKIDILIDNGKRKKVRPKDIFLLHPGPIIDFDLKVENGNVEEAWDLLQGESPNIEDLAVLIFGDFSPKSAWSAWKLIEEGLYFSGSVNAIIVNNPEVLSEKIFARERKKKDLESWLSFKNNVENSELNGQDRNRLLEVEKFALNHSEGSNILRKLEIKESIEAAHKFLIDCGYWKLEKDPWPERSGIDLDVIDLKVPKSTKNDQIDLTRLEAYAIDDKSTKDPDDAISVDGDYVWVHVADVSALVSPESEIDLVARKRCSNLYLPNFTRYMLPEDITNEVALGLKPISSALSIGFLFDGKNFKDIQIFPSKVRVVRETYDSVDKKISDEPFASLLKLTSIYQKNREMRGAISLEFPEVSVKAFEDNVEVKPISKGPSHKIVTNAMIMAGEAIAIFAKNKNLPIPYVAQEEPEQIIQPKTLSEMYTYRRSLRPSRTGIKIDRHFGLGLDMYCRSTSPLRRYSDLLVHQQLRAYLTGKTPLSEEEMNDRVLQIDSLNNTVRRVERQSNTHFKLIYLLQKKHAKYEAVIIGFDDRKALVVIPELSFETKILKKADFKLDQKIKIELVDINIPFLEANFRLIDEARDN